MAITSPTDFMLEPNSRETPLNLPRSPARDFANDVVERRFEAGGRALGDVVFQLVQAVSEAQFRRDEGQRITGRFGRQRRRTAQPGVHLDHAVVFRVRVEGVLHIAFADDPDVPDDLDRQFSQFMVFRIGKRLRRGHNDAFAGMDAQRVEVLHIADRDAVVVAVAHDLVFDLFPAFQRFFRPEFAASTKTLCSPTRPVPRRCRRNPIRGRRAYRPRG